VTFDQATQLLASVNTLNATLVEVGAAVTGLFVALIFAVTWKG